MLQFYSQQFPEMNLAKTERALRLLRKASLLIREIEAYFTSHDLSQTRFLIMIVLDREQELENISMSYLVDQLDVSKTVITNTLKTLEKDEIISITSCEKDGRSKVVSLTPKGREKLYDILPGYYTLIDKFSL